MGLIRYLCCHTLGPHELNHVKIGVWGFYIMFYWNMVMKMLKYKNDNLMTSHFSTLWLIMISFQSATILLLLHLVYYVILHKYSNQKPPFQSLWVSLLPYTPLIIYCTFHIILHPPLSWLDHIKLRETKYKSSSNTIAHAHKSLSNTT